MALPPVSLSAMLVPLTTEELLIGLEDENIDMMIPFHAGPLRAETVAVSLYAEIMKTDGSHSEVSRLIRDSAAGGGCFGYNAPSAGRFRATCHVMIMKPQTIH